MSVVHCKQQSFDVYIGRGRCPVTDKPGAWGNPFVVGRDGDRKQVIALYRAWLWKQLKADRGLIDRLAQLDGMVLGCWCSPQPCHGDVLVKAAAWARADLDRRLAESAAQTARLEAAMASGPAA